jgi:DNA-binding SARP family transcriptional activator/tetratricopeptide (TPR) repeat protein
MSPVTKASFGVEEVELGAIHVLDGAPVPFLVETHDSKPIWDKARRSILEQGSKQLIIKDSCADVNASVARLTLLGDLRLITANGQDITPHSAKGRALLAYLALAPKGAADRGKIAGLMWSEGRDSKASLRQCVRELRNTLAAADVRILEADMHHIRLDVSKMWVDALELERLSESSDVSNLERMVALYRGDLIESIEISDTEFDYWLRNQRSHLRDKACGWLERALRQIVVTSDAEALSRVTRALLTLNPAHEEAHQVLMRQHALRGDLAAATRQYLDCRAALANHFSTIPSRETEDLIQQIRTRTYNVGLAKAPLSRTIAPISTRPPISVELQAPISADVVHQTMAAAVTAAIRETLSHNSFLTLVDTSANYARIATDSIQDLERTHYHVHLSLLQLPDKVRLHVELLEVGSNRIVWAEHHDRTLGGDTFAAATSIATAIACRIAQEAEITIANRQIGSLSAYAQILRAIPRTFKLTRDSFFDAEKSLLTAQQIDPYDSLVYAWRAYWYSFGIGQGWIQNQSSTEDELDWLVRRAIELDPKNSLALAIAGHNASFVRHDYLYALHLFERSLQLDPTSAYATDLKAVTLCYMGDPTQALQLLSSCQNAWQERSDIFCYWTSICIAYLFSAQYDRAVVLGEKIVRTNPNYLAAYRPLIASLGHLGRIEEALRYLARLRQAQPSFCIGWFHDNYPPLEDGCRERYMVGLRKAGVGD